MCKRFSIASIGILIAFGTQAQISDLIISEYVEGSGNNRAIELYNGTGAQIDLGIYKLERDLNGNGTFSYYYKLVGTLANGKTFVIGNPNATVELINKVNVTHQIITEFTGDDQIRLLKNGVEIDRIGVSGGVIFAQNCTYVRNSDVVRPKPGEQDPRTNGEWVKYDNDFFNDLGIFFSPTQKFSYIYDDSGNRKERSCIVLKSKLQENSSSSGVNEQKSENVLPVIDVIGERTIKIYPNPTKGQLILRITGAEYNETHSYNLFGINGNLILSGQGVGSVDIPIDMSSCINGIYILVVKSNGEQTSYKVIKE